jgi:REP element-mobilizing transposase RayT
VFIDAVTAKETHAQFLRIAAQEHFAILAYCLMPDHAHLLVEGLSDRADFKRFVKLSKQCSGARYAIGTVGHYGRTVTTNGYSGKART